MNPKTPQDLDPKLKEAYDRVMGGNLKPSDSPLAGNPIPKIETVPTAPVTNPILPSAPLPNPIPINTQPINVMSPSTTVSVGGQAGSAKKKSRISPIIFLVVGLVFFVIYAVVWGKVFNLF